jgi:hypothetical protein
LFITGQIHHSKHQRKEEIQHHQHTQQPKGVEKRSTCMIYKTL